MAETMGSRIRRARERYGMSQATLARRIGISGTALNQIESGKTPDPGVSRIVGIARVLGVSTDSLLLGDQGEDVTPPPAAHSPAKRPTPASREVRPPPPRGRDRADAGQDAAKPLCGACSASA